MREDVAVDDVVAGVVDEAAAQLEVAGDFDGLTGTVGILRRRAVGVVHGDTPVARGDGKDVKPDRVLRYRGITRLPGGWVERIDGALPGPEILVAAVLEDSGREGESCPGDLGLLLEREGDVALDGLDDPRRLTSDGDLVPGA